MTEMVYGSMPSRVTEPVLPRWWRTIDKWSLTAIMVLFGELKVSMLPGSTVRSSAAFTSAFDR